MSQNWSRSRFVCFFVFRVCVCVSQNQSFPLTIECGPSQCEMQAFVEMGSTDQAGDIEKYFTSNPMEVEGTQVQFTVSEQFNFLKVFLSCFSTFLFFHLLFNRMNYYCIKFTVIIFYKMFVIIIML